MENQMSWDIIVNFLLSIIGGMIIIYLRSIKQGLAVFSQRIDQQDSRIAESENELKKITQRISDCKVDCNRTTVSKEDWVRGEAVSRSELKTVTSILNRMEGQLTIIEKLPDICGQIASQIAAKFQKGNNNG